MLIRKGNRVGGRSCDWTLNLSNVENLLKHNGRKRACFYLNLKNNQTINKYSTSKYGEHAESMILCA